MKIAYLDCFSGISGDMTLGALLALGFTEAALREGLAGLPIGGYNIEVSAQKHQGIMATGVKVVVEEHKQPHRHFSEIRKILSDSSLPQRVRRLAEEIFLRIAQAEASVHGVPVDKVHFHEVGAVDSLVDIIGVALGLDALGIEECFVSSLPLGSGFVRCQHGLLPVPAPATVEILKGMRVKEHPAEMELVTPTGAAIAAVLAGSDHRTLPPLRIHNVGYGAGSRQEDYPNLLRILVGEKVRAYDEDKVLVLECQIDDMQPELYPYLMEKLLQAGALDVCFIPMQMKKGRAGILIQVLVEPEERLRIAEIIFMETTTLGIRASRADRIKLNRRPGQIKTPFGPIAIKIVDGPCLQGEEVRPEFEACKQVALEKDVPLRQVYDAVLCSSVSDNVLDFSFNEKKEKRGAFPK